MTANYSVESLKAKLGKMNGTQESIQVTSYWFLFHIKHAEESVETWAENLAQSQPSRKLFYLYLANDVLQQAKKKGNQFATAFESVLPKVFESQFKYVSTDMKQKVKKVLNVWKDRKVYDDKFCTMLERVAELNRNIAASSAAAPSLPSDIEESEDEEKSGQSYTVPPMLKGLGENMRALAENEVSKVPAITKVNSIPSKLFLKEAFYNVHDRSQLEKTAGEISDALAHLGVFESQLSTEMMTRENIKRDAIEILREQDQHLQSLAAQHREIIEKQESLKALAQDIVNKISFGSGGASVFSLPTSVAGLLNKSPAAPAATSSQLAAESASSAAAASSSIIPNSMIHPLVGVHPATLDRISFSLGGQNDDDDFQL